MSWIEKLYETYGACDGAPQFADAPLMPISHVAQQAHIEIVLDSSGNYLRAKVLEKEETIVPATEGSAGRTGKKPPPHPLCDKIQYCAADYLAFGGEKESFHGEYLELLRRWCSSGYAHPKVQAVLAYVEKGTVVADLVREQLLFCDASEKLLTEWKADAPTPAIFKMLTPHPETGKRDQGNAFVRWRVEIPHDQFPLVSKDPAVREAWIQFDAPRNPNPGLCMVSGEMTPLASSHPKRLRHGGDGAKLISSNDNTNYTFRGRFVDGEEACGVGFEVSQRAHIALRWLIVRQGEHAKNGDQVFVTWSIGGEQIPDPMKNTAQLFLDATAENGSEEQYVGDAGQLFALRLNKLMAGYGAKLGNSSGVVVMGLDSASPGRMAITFYRELTGSEFLQRVLDWHSWHAWHQSFSKNMRFVGAPAPRDIAEAAFGKRLDEKLRKSTVERLLPCIVDGRPVPRDLVDSVVRRSCNRVGLEPWEWEKCLGIACGLWRGYRKEKNYQMSLEEDRTTRDYLFGRLLAIADYTEQQALRVAKEERDSNAGKLMQRFADHPCSTWRTVELALVPYKARLRANRPGQLVKLDKLLDSVCGMFQRNDFTSDAKLSGEFLLGFHCQRAALWTRQDGTKEPAVENEEAVRGDEE